MCSLFTSAASPSALYKRWLLSAEIKNSSKLPLSANDERTNGFVLLRMPREKYNEHHQNDGAATTEDYGGGGGGGQRGHRKKGYGAAAASASSEPLAKKKNKGESVGRDLGSDVTILIFSV